MKTPLVALLSLLLAAHPLGAIVFSDAAGEQFPANEHPHLDIVSVEVTHDDPNLTFVITLSGSPVATNWGKYCIGIDTAKGGDTASNGWLRPISMDSGMDYWIGSWVDGGGGAQLYAFNGAWSQIADSAGGTMPAPDITATTLTLVVPYTLMGLAENDAFTFDVYTMGGGKNDSANDAAAQDEQTINDWSQAYNSGPVVLSYTIGDNTGPTRVPVVSIELLIDSIEVELVWQSEEDALYTVFASDDLAGWQPVQQNIPSDGGTSTLWTDDSLKNLDGRRFYYVVKQ